MTKYLTQTPSGETFNGAVAGFFNAATIAAVAIIGLLTVAATV